MNIRSCHTHKLHIYKKILYQYRNYLDIFVKNLYMQTKFSNEEIQLIMECASWNVSHFHFFLDDLRNIVKYKGLKYGIHLKEQEVFMYTSNLFLKKNKGHKIPQNLNSMVNVDQIKLGKISILLGKLSHFPSLTIERDIYKLVPW